MVWDSLCEIDQDKRILVESGGPCEAWMDLRLFRWDCFRWKYTSPANTTKALEDCS